MSKHSNGTKYRCQPWINHSLNVILNWISTSTTDPAGKNAQTLFCIRRVCYYHACHALINFFLSHFHPTPTTFVPLSMPFLQIELLAVFATSIPPSLSKCSCLSIFKCFIAYYGECFLCVGWQLFINITSSSAAAERPRKPLSQLKSCQLLHNCTKNHIWLQVLPFHVV